MRGHGPEPEPEQGLGTQVEIRESYSAEPELEPEPEPELVQTPANKMSSWTAPEPLARHRKVCGMTVKGRRVPGCLCTARTLNSNENK